MWSFKIFKVVCQEPFLFLSALTIFARNSQRTYFLFFRAIFAILVLSVWWRFVAMLRSKQDVPNDQVNRWFPLLIKFHLIDGRLECLLFILFMYVFYLLPQNGILNIETKIFFYLHDIMLLCNWDLAIYAFSRFTRSTSLKCFFETVSYKESFKDFPNVLFSCKCFKTLVFWERLFPGASIYCRFWQKYLR